MTIKTIQKVIKVGSSLAVTIPARDAKAAGIKPGQDVEVSVKPTGVNEMTKTQDLSAEYKAFKAEYGDTLAKLANR